MLHIVGFESNICLKATNWKQYSLFAASSIVPSHVIVPKPLCDLERIAYIQKTNPLVLS